MATNDAEFNELLGKLKEANKTLQTGSALIAERVNFLHARVCGGWFRRGITRLWNGCAKAIKSLYDAVIIIGCSIVVCTVVYGMGQVGDIVTNTIL